MWNDEGCSKDAITPLEVRDPVTCVRSRLSHGEWLALEGSSDGVDLVSGDRLMTNRLMLPDSAAARWQLFWIMVTVIVVG